MTPPAAQLRPIHHDCVQIVPEDELLKKLARSAHTGKLLRVKYGIDSTGIDVHRGHAVPLCKLWKDF